VTVPGVVLTRTAPPERRAQLVRTTPAAPVAPTRELADVVVVPAPAPAGEPMHDRRLRWHPHE
jgi:Flp pilus assembly protein CpaB